MRIVLFALALCTPLAGAAPDADWPQWRGPNRDGVAAGKVKLADAFPEDGPKLLWESAEEIPSDHYGGHSSIAIAGGRAYLSLVWHRDVPTEKRTLDDRVMRSLDYTHANMDRAFVDKVEAARLKLSPRLRGKTLTEFTQKWMDENLSEDQRLKLDFYVKKRFTKGKAAIAIGDLDVIGKHKGKEFPNQAEFDKWLTKLPLDEAVKEKVRDAVPDTEMAADDVVLCIDLETGKTLWKKSLPGDKTNRGQACTPAVAGDRVYTVGSGELHCLDAKTGKHHWSSPVKGKAAGSSVLVAGDRVFALADQLHAFSAESGSSLWEQPAVKGKNSSPLLVEGQLVVSGNNTLSGVDPATGDVKWTVDGGGDSSPVAAGNLLVQYAKGKTVHTLRAFQLGAGEPEEIWNHEIKARRAAASPIVKDGYVYLLGGDRHLCADLKTGKIRWQEERSCSIASPLLADGKIYVLESRGGMLCVIKESPEERVELARGKVGAMNTSSPALSGSKMLLRSKERVLCFDLAGE